MIKDIQEKRIESELMEVKEHSKINPIRVKKITKDQYAFEVSVKKDEVKGVREELKDDVLFEISMIANYPICPPRVYCKSQFCSPSICDGRDILEDVIGTNWVSNFIILDIVKKLPTFVTEFLNGLSQGVLMLVGSYYLGEKYDLSFFNSLPLYVQKVKEQIVINGKMTEVAKVLVISDVFFLIFEQEKWSKNNLILTFWSNIKALATIKKVINGNIVRFFWRQNNPKELYEMALAFEQTDDLVVTLVLDKMQKYGINYQISKNRLGPREGVLPPIDIEMVEEKIAELETQVESQTDIVMIQYLMSLYQNAIEYYSATNNQKYKIYADKIHATLNSESMVKFLDSKRDDKKDETKVDHTIDGQIEQTVQGNDCCKEIQNKITEKLMKHEETTLVAESNNNVPVKETSPQSENKSIESWENVDNINSPEEKNKNDAPIDEPVEEPKLVLPQAENIKNSNEIIPQIEQGGMKIVVANDEGKIDLNSDEDD